jgi:hypothetical protein
MEMDTPPSSFKAIMADSDEEIFKAPGNEPAAQQDEQIPQSEIGM